MNYFEGFGYRASGAGEAEGATGFVHLAVATDQHAYAGAIDEVEGGQVDDELAATFGDEALYGCFGVTEGVAEMKAAGDLDDGGRGLNDSRLKGIRHRVKDITLGAGLTCPVMFLLN